MCDVMTFPETVNGFFEQYGIWDREEVYTNGALLIPVFRVEQMLDHYFRERTCHMTRDIDYPCVEEGCKRLMFPKWICSECEWDKLGEKPNYCPNCGAKVMEQ